MPRIARVVFAGIPHQITQRGNRCTCVMRKTSIVARMVRVFLARTFFLQPARRSVLVVLLRYVERNPVRAGIVQCAEDYPWSSAAAHCGLQPDSLVTKSPAHWDVFERITDWSAWLAEEDDHQRLQIVRRNVHKNLPCGSDAFVERLERISQRSLHFRPIGRPPTSGKG